MNPHSIGRGNLLSEISRARSKRKRSAALSAAAEGLSAMAVAKRAEISIDLAREILTEHRLAIMPHLVDHQISVDGVIYEDLAKLSERFSLSDARLRELAKRHSLTKIWAINPQTGQLSACYQPEKMAARLVSWSSRHSHFQKYRQLVSSHKVERYPELSEPLMATLIGLLVLLKETSGTPPSYEEIEQAAGLPAKLSRRYVPELEKLGFISRLPVYNPRRGHPSFRYLIHRAPAKLVTYSLRCSDCGSTSWVPYPWYQAKRFGNGVGK